MRVIALLAFLAATPALAQEDTTFLLYKWEQPIGEEYLRVQPGARPQLRSAFSFADRGTKVPLAALLVLGPDGLPTQFQMWGKTSRFSETDVEVLVQGGRASIRDGKTGRQAAVPKLFFTANGYAPMAVKEAMIAAWHRHGRPAELPLLPTGVARIESRGQDSFERPDGKKIALERIIIRGLKWGLEVAWIDERQRLIGVVTNDAEFSHFEVMRTGYDDLLGPMVARAGEAGMQALAELAPRPIHEGRWAIAGVRLPDGTTDATVVVDGGKIVAAGRAAAPSGIPVLDGKGKTLLPGLWDMHAHFEQVEWGPIYLAAGVTTVRDAGNTLSFLQGLRGAKLGPRILCAGFLDGNDGRAAGNLHVASAADIVPVVAKIKAAGCTQIKIYSFLEPTLVAPLAREAHRQGLGVAGHIPDGMRLPAAIAAGYDLVSHMNFVASAFMPPEMEMWQRRQRWEAFVGIDPDSPKFQGLYKQLARRHVVIDPTLALSDLLLNGPSTEPGLAKVTPELRVILSSFGMPADSPAQELAWASKLMEKNIALVGRLHRAGVTIVAGTDQSVPGHSLYHELELYVRAGMTPLEAIQSATSVPARVMKLDKELGTIAVGKRADLVLVDGDPLTNISDIRKISVVIKDGTAYETAKLWPLAGFTP